LLILVSNDDGVHAPGLKALVEGLAPLGRVVVVAPDRERSGVSHSLTLHRPLRLTKVATDWYSSDGTPTDCVHLGVHSVLGEKPDLLVSGINAGPNLGDDVTYSGTVGVALEGALLGVPAIAVSLVAREDFNFAPAAAVAHRVAKAALEHPMRERTFLNVNIPNVKSVEELGTIRITTQGRRIFGSGIVKKTDPRGAEYFWIGGEELGFVDGDTNSDIHAVTSGDISITPLQTDLTAPGLGDELKGWRL
jgi:5'-nucleotidase